MTTDVVSGTPLDEEVGAMVPVEGSANDHQPTAPATEAPSTPDGDSQGMWRAVVGIVLVAAVIAAGGIVVERRFGGDNTVARIQDDFDMTAPETGLGELDWANVAGEFASDDGLASVSKPNPVGPRTLAVVDVGNTNATISVTAGQLANGWGVVFRYAGPVDFWYLQAAPAYAVFSVNRVADGEVQPVGATSLVELRDGMRVDIVLRGDRITISTGGREIFRREDDHAYGARRAGLLATSDAVEEGTWDRFDAVPASDMPTPAGVIIRRPLPSAPATDAVPESVGEAEEPPSAVEG